MVFVTLVVEHWLEWEIAQWVHPMKDRSDDPSHHEQTLLPRSYILLIPFYEVIIMTLIQIIYIYIMSHSINGYISIENILNRSLILIISDWAHISLGAC